MTTFCVGVHGIYDTFTRKSQFSGWWTPNPMPGATWGRTQPANQMESRDRCIDPIVSGVLASHWQRRQGIKWE
jgi:hypothetical protein